MLRFFCDTPVWFMMIVHCNVTAKKILVSNKELVLFNMPHRNMSNL